MTNVSDTTEKEIGCKICGNNKNNNIHIAKETMFGMDETFRYLECSSCGCLQLITVPEDLSKYYPVNYFSFNTIPRLRQSYFNILKSNIIKQRNSYVLTGKGIIGMLFNKMRPASSMIYMLEKAHANLDSRVLDVGCGIGGIIYHLGNTGFRNVSGVDPFIKDDITYENGVKIQKGSFYDVKGEYDVIMFIDSFEHMADPGDVLAHANRLLSKDGVCIISIPIAGSYSWKKYGVNWHNIDAPRHVFLYTVKSIKSYASTYGLELFDHVFDSAASQFWGSEQNLKNIIFTADNSYYKNPSKSIFSEEKVNNFKLKAIELNRQEQGDHVTLFFRKAAYVPFMPNVK